MGDDPDADYIVVQHDDTESFIRSPMPATTQHQVPQAWQQSMYSIEEKVRVLEGMHCDSSNPLFDF